MSTRVTVFRSLAGVVSVGMLLFAAVLLFWALSGSVAWSRAAPSLLGQVFFGVLFGMYSLGLLGRFGKSFRS